MKLISFLFKSSPRMVILAILAGVISGICSTILLGLVGRSLSDLHSITSQHLRIFVAMCLIVPIMRFISEALLVRIGQGAVFKQRLQLSRRILAAPLRQLEQIGAHRLMAALTDDVLSISAAVLIVPLTTINVAVVAYLLFAKRLFGVRGGAAAEHAIREADVGWQALDRASPEAAAQALQGASASRCSVPLG